MDTEKPRRGRVSRINVEQWPVVDGAEMVKNCTLSSEFLCCIVNICTPEH